MKDIIIIIKSPKDLGLLVKGFTQKIENETEEQRGRFLDTLLGILGANIVGNMLVGIGVIKADDEVARAGQDF